jgi:hypothetical protein
MIVIPERTNFLPPLVSKYLLKSAYLLDTVALAFRIGLQYRLLSAWLSSIPCIYNKYQQNQAFLSLLQASVNHGK